MGIIPLKALSHWIQCSTHIIGKEIGKKQIAHAEHTIASACMGRLVLNGVLEFNF
jgi:hypothetical protein